MSTMVENEIGIVYHATGSRHIELAVRSAESAKRHMPEVSITLFSDEPPDSNCISNHIEVEPTPTTKTHRISRIECLSNTPYEKTLYLDSDTYICDDIRKEFEILDRFDIVGRVIPYRERLESLPDFDNFAPEAPRKFPWYNAGVLFYRKNENTEKIFEDWNDIYLKYTCEEYAGDQLGLRESLYKNKMVDIGSLPPEYNLFPAVAGSAWNKIKITHAVPDSRNRIVNHLPELSEQLNYSIEKSETSKIVFDGVHSGVNGKVYIPKKGQMFSNVSKSYRIPSKYSILYKRAKEIYRKEGARPFLSKLYNYIRNRRT